MSQHNCTAFPYHCCTNSNNYSYAIEINIKKIYKDKGSDTGHFLARNCHVTKTHQHTNTYNVFRNSYVVISMSRTHTFAEVSYLCMRVPYGICKLSGREHWYVQWIGIKVLMSRSGHIYWIKWLFSPFLGWLNYVHISVKRAFNNYYNNMCTEIIKLFKNYNAVHIMGYWPISEYIFHVHCTMQLLAMFEFYRSFKLNQRTLSVTVYMLVNKTVNTSV